MTDSSEARMWQEINASQKTLQNHGFRIDALEVRTDRIGKDVEANFCTVCKKIDGLKETVVVMEAQRKIEEKHASHVFDRWLPLILGVVASALAVAKYLAP